MTLSHGQPEHTGPDRCEHRYTGSRKPWYRARWYRSVSRDVLPPEWLGHDRPSLRDPAGVVALAMRAGRGLTGYAGACPFIGASVTRCARACRALSWPR
jgi:hypothetical protein